jgi:ubiquinol-cytochrome c reductase cytochrome b subunit
MAIVPNPHGTTGLMGWIDDRFPWTKLVKDHATEYYAAKTFNFWYVFGVLATVVLVNQLITGIFLTMHYKPSALEAFGSVEYIMRDVPFGWLIRYMHSTGASAFFIVIYLHMFRGILYGSYRQPRELIWIFGWMIFLALMAEGFMGYVLPWGNMSYWGAQVIINLFGAIPMIGPDLVDWIRGDFLISDATLNRFFALHVIALPFVIVGLVFAHLMALHEVGSNNPDGIEIKKHKDENGIPLDGIAFHPFHTSKDLVAIVIFMILFAGVIFFAPEMGGYFIEPPNFTPANPLVTPSHIAPVWYFTPFYSVLRAVTYPLFGVDAKFWGVIAMGASVVIIAFLPWLDRSPVKSIRYKSPIFAWVLGVFVVAFVVLGYLGFEPATPRNTAIAQVCTVIYFAFFLLMPWYSKLGTAKPVPERVTGYEK